MSRSTPSRLQELLAPITRTGWITLAIGAVAYLLGWRLGWIELIVTAAGVLVAFLIAVAFVLGRFSLTMERTIEPDRVQVGEVSVATLRVRNKLRPTAAGTATDLIGDEEKTLAVPALGPNGTFEDEYELPTERRGAITVGPLVSTKADPLGLLRRDAKQDENRQLIVHPETVPLPPLHAGFVKDLEGPTNEQNPKGDIAFHALREYVRGDDHRHIHWKSSARTGSLMVRQYVDNRRPHLTVLLDTDPASYRGDTFELAVSAAASLAVMTAESQQSTALYFDADNVASAAHAAQLSDTLDSFSFVERSESMRPIARTAAAVLSMESATTTMVVVTGAQPPSAIISLDVAVRGAVKLIIVRALGPDDAAVANLSRVDVVNVHTLDGFRAGWLRAMR